ncbi:MAG: cysteine--tRNA ligase [Spirochaetaceae bacterium]|nr:cysteine--tRNA ligase [Spirochaetaceae bacterium]MDT8296657.1 cysteine--tRNA ligase [Spirochaetaceae bacterium]
MKPLRLYNSDGREMQPFTPLKEGMVGLYCCGPTVYNYAHIGNLRAYTHWDILRRTLERFGYAVNHVMNITDVGHLTDDGDEGEDKMIKGARERGMTVWEIAQFFTDAFFRDISRLNIKEPTVSCKATEHIADMIGLVERLEKNGFSYLSGGNLYFDSTKLADYGRLALLDRQELQHGARVEVDENKKHPLDFVLWFTRSKFQNQAMTWDSPWGRGYPGWHLECSAMSSKYLGEHFDIHTGGVDHIPVHHTNEIAQSEGAFGHKWVNYWVHNEFLIMKSGKMSKSKGGFLTLQSLVDDGYDPLDYRYFLLGGHYRSQLIFSVESLDAARSARKSLMGRLTAFRRDVGDTPIPQSSDLGDSVRARLDAFNEALGEDLNTPRALAEVWGLVKDDALPPAERLAALLDMDGVLGLKLDEAGQEDAAGSVDEELADLLRRRDEARNAKDWAAADEIRDELASLGWKVVDTPDGPRLEKA